MRFYIFTLTPQCNVLLTCRLKTTSGRFFYVIFTKFLLPVILEQERNKKVMTFLLCLDKEQP